MFPPFGPVVQLVRTLACHARGQGFESPSGRQYKRLTERSIFYVRFASVAQLVEQGTENPRVVGSIPTGGTISEIFSVCGFSSFGRASPCQGEGGGFEPRNPLQNNADANPFASAFVTFIWRHGQAVRHGSAKPLSPVRFRVAPPKNPARKCGIFTFYLLPLHSYLKWQDFLGSNR